MCVPLRGQNPHGELFKTVYVRLHIGFGDSSISYNATEGSFNQRQERSFRGGIREFPLVTRQNKTKQRMVPNQNEQILKV